MARSTLYRWTKRYKEQGKEGLKDRSKRPKTLARQKVRDLDAQFICSIRTEFQFGPQRIHMHLQRVHAIELSAATIWRVVKPHNLPAVKRYRRHKDFKRYSRPVPGERVQMDVTKVAPKCYPFTAIDDCTRMRALKLYADKNAESAADFVS